MPELRYTLAKLHLGCSFRLCCLASPPPTLQMCISLSPMRSFSQIWYFSRSCDEVYPARFPFCSVVSIMPMKEPHCTCKKQESKFMHSSWFPLSAVETQIKMEVTAPHFGMEVVGGWTFQHLFWKFAVRHHEKYLLAQWAWRFEIYLPPLNPTCLSYLFIAFMFILALFIGRVNLKSTCPPHKITCRWR